MVRLLAAIAALLTLAAAEHHHSPPPRQLRRSLSTSEPAEPPTPVHGYERLEVDAAFIPLAMASCTPSCTASLGALLSGVRADMSAAMAITPSRIHFGGVAASAGGTHVYFTVAAEAGGLATERTSAEAKIALSAATTASGAPMQLGGAAASKYTPSGDSLPCTYCLSLSESCAATAMAACANVVADGTAATCTGAGACSHTAADAAAPTAEACVASDQAACAAADLDGLAATCTAAGACTYSSSISNVTVTFLAVEEEHTSHAPLGVAFTFAMISLMLGTFVKTLLDLIPPGAYHPPYSVLIFALGMLCAQLDYSLNANGEISPEIHESVEYWLAVDPHVIMYGLLPPLLFESAFGVDFHVFVKVAAMSVIMALPGVIVATGCTAAVSMLFFSDCCHVQLWDCVLMGSILSATDPVAVVGVLNTLGAPAHLKHMIEGESLLNDGSAVVIFLIAQQMMDAENQLTGGEMLLKFLKLAGGGVLWGYVAGYIAFYWCKLSRHASVVDVAVLILCTYMVFYIGEHGFHVSGVLAAVTFGILFSRLAPHAMSEHVIHANHVVFSQICHFAETHIFVLAGLIIYARFFLSESHIDKSFHFPLGCAMYLAIHVIRGSVIAIFSPLLSRLGYGITLGEGIIMTYGGLRGAVSLAMALMLDADLSVDIVIRELIVFHTGVIVVLTIVINGMTAGALYNYLNMYPANAFRAELRERGFRVLAAEVESIYEVFKKDWFHQLADPATLKKVCPDFTKAKAKFGEIHVPDSDVEQIFFGFQGYVHKELYGWKRVGGRARQLVRHQSGSGMLAPPMTAQGDVSKSGRNLAVDHSAGQSAELSHTSTAPAKAPTQFKPGTKGGPSPNHEHELVPDLWIGGIPQYQANEACLRAIFEKLGEVRVIYFRNKPNDIGTNKPRSWAYITFGGNAEARALSVEKAKLAPIKVQRQDRSQDDVVLDVQDAEADKAASGSHATNIWDQMSKVSGNRAKQLKNSAISADNVEEAKMLMYEICFTAVNARYQEMRACSLPSSRIPHSSFLISHSSHPPPHTKPPGVTVSDWHLCPRSDVSYISTHPSARVFACLLQSYNVHTLLRQSTTNLFRSRRSTGCKRRSRRARTS